MIHLKWKDLIVKIAESLHHIAEVLLYFKNHHENEQKNIKENYDRAKKEADKAAKTPKRTE